MTDQIDELNEEIKDAVDNMANGDAAMIVMALAQSGFEHLKSQMSPPQKAQFEKAMEIHGRYIQACRYTDHLEFKRF